MTNETLEHFISGQPLLRDGQGWGVANDDDEICERETAQVLNEIKDLLDTRNRPAVAREAATSCSTASTPPRGVIYLHSPFISERLQLLQGPQNS